MTSESEQWLRRQEAVEGALRHRDEERRKEQRVTRRNRQTPCCKKGEFEAVIYICCTPLGLAALAMLVPFTIVFLSSNEDLVRRFQEGTCTVVRYNDTGMTVACKCTQGRWCVSNYPCFILYTTLEYKDGAGKDQKATAQLYENMYGVSNNEKCSVKRCIKDSTSNQERVHSFKKSWSEIGKYTTCYYDTTDPQKAAMNRPTIVPIRWDFLPFVICVGAVAIIAWLIIFLTCCLYGCADCCIWVKENNRLCPRRHSGDIYIT